MQTYTPKSSSSSTSHTSTSSENSTPGSMSCHTSPEVFKFSSENGVFFSDHLFQSGVNSSVGRTNGKLNNSDIHTYTKHKSKSVDELLNESPKRHTLKNHTPSLKSNSSTHLLDILRDENQTLKKELESYYERVRKLQKLEHELQQLQISYRLLEGTTARKAKLEQTMRERLEDELLKIKQANTQQKAQLNTIKRNASFKGSLPDQLMKKELARRDSMITRLIQQNEDASSVRQRLEKDLHTARTALHERKSKTEEIKNERHQPKPSLETEQESQLAISYSSSLDKLHSILTAMQNSNIKRQKLEQQLRHQLEKKVSELQGSVKKEEKTDEDQELQIAALKSDLARMEHKCLELIAEREFAIDSVLIPRETHMSQMDRLLKEKEIELEDLKEQKMQFTIQLEEAHKTITNHEHRISSLQTSLKEKESLIDTLQSLLDPDDISTQDDTLLSNETSSLQTDPRVLSTEVKRKLSGGVPIVLDNQKPQIDPRVLNLEVKRKLSGAIQTVFDTQTPQVLPSHCIRRTSSPLPSYLSTHQNTQFKHAPVINQVTPNIQPSLPSYAEHVLGTSLSDQNPTVYTSGGYRQVCSHSFPNTPETIRRRTAYQQPMSSNMTNSVPLTPMYTRGRGIYKSLTPPPIHYLNNSSKVNVSSMTKPHSQMLGMNVPRYDDYDSVDSLDMIIQPVSSPSISPPSSFKSNRVKTDSTGDTYIHKHSNSSPTSQKHTITCYNMNGTLPCDSNGHQHTQHYDMNGHAPLHL